MKKVFFFWKVKST